VKSLESFYSKLDQAEPGIRLAVGLQSLEKIEVARGDVVYYPADLSAGDMIAVKIVCEADARRFVKQGRTITLLHGTSEIEGNLQLAPDEVAESNEFVAVLRLERSSIFKCGDRFVLRLTTPSRLIGGGLIIDPNLKSFSRRDSGLWSRLRRAATLEVRTMITYELEKELISKRGQLLSQSGFARREIEAAVDLLLKEKTLLEFDGELILSSSWQEAEATLLALLKEFHEAHPHQATLPLAELRSRVSLPEALVDRMLGELVKSGKLIKRDSGIKLAASSSGLSVEQERLRVRIESLLGEATSSCLARSELFSLDKEARNVYTYLRQNDLIVDANGTVYLKTTFEAATNVILGQIRANGRITVAEARDLTGSSRKFVLPILEELDRRRITRREGDYRVLWQ
jgi:selenocysteine-specific elongation factor